MEDISIGYIGIWQNQVLLSSFVVFEKQLDVIFKIIKKNLLEYGWLTMFC